MTKRPHCDLYLDTINRTVLDFDFERLCSVSLSNLNVYACLVCGKYFQGKSILSNFIGRGPSSHAYTHSLDKDHHVFLNLSSLKVYVLPESYEVQDTSLSDIQVIHERLIGIQYVVNPTFDPNMIQQLDAQLQVSMDLHKKKYHPGFVGLNNIKANDYMSVIVHCFAHIKPIRNYFLGSPKLSSELAHRFGLLLRKIWNPKAFKGHVSPHEFMQQVSSDSKKRFTLTKQMDAVEFLSWFLNTLHVELGGNRKPKSSIIHQTFQGRVRIETQAILVNPDDEHGVKRFDIDREIKIIESPFLMLTLDLPPPPLFQDELEKNIIPQVPLTDLLKKYDGTTAQEQGEMLRRCQLLEAPPFLILNIKRMTKNNFTVEKNPTIVNFPLTHLDMAPCKQYLILIMMVVVQDSKEPIYYELLANISLDGKVGDGHYKIHVHCQHRWFCIEDLMVNEILPQMLFLSESHIQIWKKSVRH